MTLTELIAAATPGPWNLDNDGWCQQAEDWDSQQLVVAAVNKLPALIAALKAADALVDNAGTAFYPDERGRIAAYRAARAAVGDV